MVLLHRVHTLNNQFPKIMIKDIPLKLSNSWPISSNAMRYTMHLGKIAMLLLLMCMSLLCYSQTTLRGKVLDTDNNPLSGVTITEKGSTNATSTASDGSFSLNVTSNQSIIVIS